MMELLVVIVVVGAALAWAGRAVWRSAKGKNTCASCSEAGNCPLVDNPDLLTELTQSGKLAHLDKCNPSAADCKDLLAELEAKDKQ